MKVSDVNFSLSVGHLLWGVGKVPIIILIALSMLFPILTIVMLCTPLVWNTIMIVAFSLINIFSLILFCFSLKIIIKDKNNKKKVSLWLKDAVEAKAYSKIISEDWSWLLCWLIKGRIIRVNFKINGKRFVRDSNFKFFGGEKGYIYGAKYINKEIRIAYSPKYDEVMILKDNINDKKQ